MKKIAQNQKKIFQMKMTKKIKMDIKIVQNGHKNSLMNKKSSIGHKNGSNEIVQMDIKKVEMNKKKFKWPKKQF